MKKKIEKLVEQKKKQTDLIYFDKYAGLFHDAYRFLATQKALLYGGQALNELLPTPLKIYEPYTLPDIDVLSPCAEKLAARMVRFYKKKKHQAVSFTEALHPGTYKVYVDGVQVADLTQCGQDTYERLLRGCVRSPQWKVKIVPPQYLRMTLHKILSQPNDAHRWENALERLKRYYKTFPLPKSSCVSNHKIDDTLVKDLSPLLPPETVYSGKKEMEQMLGKPLPALSSPIYAWTTQDLTSMANMLKQEIPGLVVSKVFPQDDFVPSHILLSTKDGQTIATLFKPSSCIAFNEVQKKRIASIHAMIDLLLSMSMSDYHHWKKDKAVLECLADELSRLQQKDTSKRKILKQIVVSCYGPTTGLITMRRERAKRLRRKKKLLED